MTLLPPAAMVIFAIITANSMVAANYVIFSGKFRIDAKFEIDAIGAGLAEKR
jgi:hypothetical protein